MLKSWRNMNCDKYSISPHLVNLVLAVTDMQALCIEDLTVANDIRNYKMLMYTTWATHSMVCLLCWRKYFFGYSCCSTELQIARRAWMRRKRHWRWYCQLWNGWYSNDILIHPHVLLDGHSYWPTQCNEKDIIMSWHLKFRLMLSFLYVMTLLFVVCSWEWHLLAVVVMWHRLSWETAKSDFTPE